MNYYIFLDIDGVLWDWNYIKTINQNGIHTKGTIKHLSPKSVFALNYLIEQLEKKYNVKLVIISTWRYHMKNTVQTLKDNGVKLDNLDILSIDNTIQNAQRGKQILNYIKNKKVDGLAIIDDEKCDYCECNLSNFLIKTNIYNNCLNINMVKNFLTPEHCPKK